MHGKGGSAWADAKSDKDTAYSEARIATHEMRLVVLECDQSIMVWHREYIAPCSDLHGNLVFSSDQDTPARQSCLL